MREADFKSVLLVADQPYQARVMGALAKKLIGRGHEVTIVIADYYTFLHAAHVIDELSLTGARVEHQQENFFSWQGEGEPGDSECTEEYLLAWEAGNCSDRSITQIERTNNFVFSDEREYFALHLSENWRRRILKDTIVWVEEIFDAHRPDVVLSIDNCTLVNNLIFSLSRSRSIPHLTCKNTRIMNRWNIRRDFCLGVSPETASEVSMASESGKWTEEVEAFRNWFNSDGHGAYVAPAHDEKKHAKYDAIKIFCKDILGLLFKVKPRVAESYRLRRAGIRRLEQSFFRLSIYELRANVRRFASAFGFHPFVALEDLPSDTYFLWALHFRPEGSVLVQGLGVDEISYLETCSLSLPEGAFLYVKEHPFMFGYRAKDFYERLKSIPSVKLIAPWENSLQLIQGSAGVVGVAGTVLLEAEIAGKPGWAMGKPEFVDYLTGSGAEELTEFLKNSADASGYAHLSKKINDYLAYVFASSEEDDFWLNDAKIPIEKQDLSRVLDRMEAAIEGVFSA